MNTLEQASGVLTVVMPAYNEEGTICEIVNRVLARPEVGELVKSPHNVPHEDVL